MRGIAVLALLSLFPLAIACGGDSTPETVEPACDIDINNLSGNFALFRADPESGEQYQDTDARLIFDKKDGKNVLTYVTRVRANPVVPIDPTTFKYEYELKSVSERGEALYVQDQTKALNDEQKAKIDEIKQQDFNKNPQRFVFEFRLYIKANMNKCRLNVGDFYFTYNKGEPLEDTNPNGNQKYSKYEGPELNTATCPQVGSLTAMQGDAKEPLRLVSEIDTTLPVKFSYEAQFKPGETPCEYGGTVFLREEKTNIAVDVKTEGDKVSWSFETPIAYKAKMPYFGDHRYNALIELVPTRSCGGKAEKIDAVCSILKPKAP